MPTHRQGTTEAAITVFGLGTSATGDLRSLFPASPLYDGSYTDARVKEVFAEKVLAPVINDGGHTFGEFNRDYVGAPNLQNVATGGGGKPGTPYAPNIASPGPGANPRNIPSTGAEVTGRRQGSGGYGNGDGLASPSETSAKIATQNRRLGDLISGRAYTR